MQEYLFSRVETIVPNLGSDSFTQDIKYECEVIPPVEGVYFEGHPFTDDNLHRLIGTIAKEFKKGDRITTISKPDITDTFDLVKIRTPLSSEEFRILGVQLAYHLREELRKK
ncbi:hypothetical protein J4405_03260 [Candidatus Woesearchaeota archaeon]|nr:hypothetical protein [Candidatus Woesearchaeota archaeon]